MASLRRGLKGLVRAGLAVANRHGTSHRFLYDENLRKAGLVITWRPETALRGVIAEVRAGAELRFFVENELDAIQSCHRRGRLYEAEELEIIAGHYRGGTFADIGGNVGNHAVWAAKVLRAPRVIVFEPNPAAARICEINLLLNDCGEVVELRRKGLASAPGRAGTVQPFEHNLGATRLVEASDGPLELARGDDELAGEYIGLLKIDTEGFELQVLEGLQEVIARDRPPIFVEVENASQPACEDFLARAGYRIAERYRRYETAINLLALPQPS